MKLTSLLLLETLSHSDYIMVNVTNISCTDNFAPADSLHRQLIEHCIATNLRGASLVGVSLNALCQEMNR